MSVGNSGKRYLIALFLLFIVGYIIHNAVALNGSYEPYCLEQSLEGSVRRFYSILDNPATVFKNIWECVGPQASERSVYELFPMPFFLLFGVSPSVAVYPNFIFLLLVVFSVYKIGRLTGDEYSGLWASFHLLMYPAIFGFTRIYFTSIATTALVSFSIYCLLSSDFFKNRQKVLLMAVCWILLAKLKCEKAPVFLLVPTLVYLYQSFRINRASVLSMKQYRFNVAIFLGCAGGLSLVLFDKSFLTSRIGYYLEVEQLADSMALVGSNISPGFFTAYIKDLFFVQLGYLGSLSFIIGAIFLLRNKLRYKSIIALWLVIPYLFHSFYYLFSGIHSAYYTIAYLPAIALIAGYGIQAILKPLGKLQRGLIAGVYVLLLLSNYLCFSYLDKQLPLLQRFCPTSFAGKTSLMLNNKNKTMIFNSAQELIEDIIAVRKRAFVVFVNHYPLLAEVYDKLNVYNAINKNNVYVYDFSNKVFNLEVPDPEETVTLNMGRADLIINGNRFYTPGSKSIEAERKQFGTTYDFSRSLQTEAAVYTASIGNFELVKNIPLSGMSVEIFLNKKIKSLLGTRVTKKKSVISPGKARSFFRKPQINKEQRIANADMELAYRAGTVRVFWKDRELTKNNLVNLSFQVEGVWYPNSDFLWKSELTESGELLLIGDCHSLPLSQIWRFSLKDNYIDWSLDLENAQEIVLKRANVAVSLIDDYSYGMGAREEGEVCSLPFREIARGIVTTPWIGLTGMPGKAVVPGVIFDLDSSKPVNKIFFDKPLNYLTGAFRTIITGDLEFRLLPGRHVLLSGRIYIFGEQKEFLRCLREIRSRTSAAVAER